MSRTPTCWTDTQELQVWFSALRCGTALAGLEHVAKCCDDDDDDDDDEHDSYVHPEYK